MGRIASVKYYDTVNGKGVSTSVFLQGCDLHCKGCHNQTIWDFNGGDELTDELLNKIVDSFKISDFTINLNILGGEPLHKKNLHTTRTIIENVIKNSPKTKVFVWTGYLVEDLLKRTDEDLKFILKNINFLIDGPYQEQLRDITLPLRGSSNQRIFRREERLWTLIN